MDKKFTADPYPWKEEYNLNVSLYDEQHKKFLEIINLLKKVISNGPERESITEVFYTLAHFVEHFHIQEEIWLKEMHYDRLARHKELHQGFIDHIEKFRKDFEEDRKEIYLDMFEYLSEWFEEHMMKTDKAVVESLSA